MDRFAIGVDIGGTTVKLGFFNAEGTLLDKWQIKTRTENKGVNILPDVAESIKEYLASKDVTLDRIVGIGIGVPGPVRGDGTVMKCANLGWGIINVKDEMNALIPEVELVEAGNDANVAALGEQWRGGGKGHDNAVMVTLGTGVGGGIILDGKIWAGSNGAGGEIGHINVNPDETVACGCGNCGCLEQYASANGIIKLGRAMLADCDKPSALRDMDTFSSKDICELAPTDEMAEEILDRCCQLLGHAMSSIAVVADPEVFVIGGGMSNAGQILIDHIKPHYQRFAFHATRDVDIKLAELGNDAGVYGCVRMVI